MRVAYLAAGAGGMYCGSCLRDNRIAATLIAMGRDVVLIPLYTPLRTDEAGVGQRRVHYGGINVYLRQKYPSFHRLAGPITRFLDAPALLRRVMRLASDAEPEELGALTVSVLRGENGGQRRELARLIDDLRAIKPDLVQLPNLMFVGLAGAIKVTLGVPVLCALSGEDIFLDGLPEPHLHEVLDLIAKRAGDVDAFVAPTHYYAGHATTHFGLPQDRTHVVPTGVNVDDVGEPARPPVEPFVIGYLARICPAKGLRILCEALMRLRRMGRRCRLRAAGYLGRADRSYLNDIRTHLRKEGAENAFEYVGEVSRAGKLEFLRSLHVLSVPTVYREAKGLYVLEAMACGVPVVQPRHGSFPELLEATGGGLLYDPSDSRALADAIARLMDDPSERTRLAAAGREAVFESFNDKVMAERIWAVFRQYAGGANA